MIDFNFNADSVSMMIAVVAVLALASAPRAYIVTTLGERIVADLRATCPRIRLRCRRPFSTGPAAGTGVAIDRRRSSTAPSTLGSLGLC